MMFRFYITDLNHGSILGTHSLQDAETFALSEDHFVVDTGSGEWLTSSGGRLEVQEAYSPEPEDEDDDDEDDDDEDDEDEDDEDK